MLFCCYISASFIHESIILFYKYSDMMSVCFIKGSESSGVISSHLDTFWVVSVSLEVHFPTNNLSMHEGKRFVFVELKLVMNSVCCFVFNVLYSRC